MEGGLGSFERAEREARGTGKSDEFPAGLGARLELSGKPGGAGVEFDGIRTMGLGWYGQQTVGIEAGLRLRMPNDMAVVDAVAKRGWFGGEVIFYGDEQAAVGVGVFLTAIPDGGEDTTGHTSQGGATGDAVDGGTVVGSGQVDDREEGRACVEGEQLDVFEGDVAFAATGAAGIVQGGHQGIHDNELGVAHGGDLVAELLAVARQLNAVALQAVPSGNEDAAGISAGGEEAGEDGPSEVVFTADEKDVGGGPQGGSGGFIGPGAAGGDAGGEIKGEEGLAEAGVAGAIVGRALYTGAVDLARALSVSKSGSPGETAC